MAAIFAAVNIWFIRVQISDGRKVAEQTRNVEAYRLVREEDDRFDSHTMYVNRRNLATVIFPKQGKMDEKVCDAVNIYMEPVLGHYETLGIMLKRGVVPEDLLWTSDGYDIRLYWQILKPCVDWARETDPTFYTEFEYLQGRMWDLDKTHRQNPVATFPQDEILDFLQHEQSLVS